MTHRSYPNLDCTHEPASVKGLEALRGWSLTAEEAMANAAATLRMLPTAADWGHALTFAQPDPGSSR